MIKKNIPLIIIFTTSILSVCYFLININSWKFSFIGDEWTFYTKAIEIAKQNLWVNPFNLNGVWGQNPVFFSLYQAIFIKLFGANNFVWRFSTVILIIPLSIFFFLWLKQLFDWRVALYSTFLMQSSFYLTNFLKIGYPNPFSLTLFIIIIYLLTKCSNNLNNKLVILFGIFLSISFYVYIGILFPIILIPYIFILYWKKYSYKKLFLPIGLLLNTCSLFLLPYLIQFLNNSSYFKIVSEKTVLSKEYVSNLQPFYNVLSNLLLFFRSNDIIYNHFVRGPYLDILSQIFATIGIAYLIYCFKNKSSKLLLFLFISTTFVIGLTSPYSYSPTTRGIFFLPFGFAFAGLGIDIFLKKASKKHYWNIGILILTIIFVLNFYQSQISIFKQYNFESTALIIKYLQEERNQNSKKMTFLIIPNKNNEYNYQNILILRQAYDLEEIGFETKKIEEINCKNISNQNILLLRQHKNLIKQIYENKCDFQLKII